MFNLFQLSEIPSNISGKVLYVLQRPKFIAAGRVKIYDGTLSLQKIATFP